MEHRTFKLENIRAEGKRTVKASISSEYPVARMNGKKEILVHTPEAVDLSRAPLPLITDHNAQQLNVGVVEDLKIVDKKLKGTLRFGSSSRAKEIWQDVVDNILTGLSVSYEVQETEDAGEYYLVTRWMPLEVSLVSVPADPSVGVGRSFERINNMEENFDDIQRQHKTLDKMTPGEIEKYLEGRRQIDAIKCSMIEPSGEKVNNRTGGFRNMGEFLQSVARYHAGGGMDRRLETRYLKEGTGSAGGFLLQPEYINEIMQSVWSSGELLKRVWSIPMQTNTLKIPAIDESSRATGSRWGGAQAYWIDEGGTKQESEPKFRRIELNLNKAVVLIPATDEVLEDAQALEAVIKSVAAKEITFCLEDAILNGTGAGRPLGIINAGATVTVNKETGQTANTIVLDNIVKMWARMKEDSLANAVWFINQTVWPELFNMYLAVGTGGSAVYLPGGGLSEAPYGTLMGKPVIPIEQCQALGTAGDIILADMSKYVWAYRELQSAMSIHVYFTTDKSVFRFVARVDGQPILASPITPYKGGSSNTLSDFVILESRT